LIIKDFQYFNKKNGASILKISIWRRGHFKNYYKIDKMVLGFLPVLKIGYLKSTWVRWIECVEEFL
jgi:hypothetical protein